MSTPPFDDEAPAIEYHTLYHPKDADDVFPPSPNEDAPYPPPSSPSPPAPHDPIPDGCCHRFWSGLGFLVGGVGLLCALVLGFVLFVVFVLICLLGVLFSAVIRDLPVEGRAVSCEIKDPCIDYVGQESPSWVRALWRAVIINPDICGYVIVAPSLVWMLCRPLTSFAFIASPSDDSLTSIVLYPFYLCVNGRCSTEVDLDLLSAAFDVERYSAVRWLLVVALCHTVVSAAFIIPYRYFKRLHVFAYWFSAVCVSLMMPGLLNASLVVLGSFYDSIAQSDTIASFDLQQRSAGISLAVALMANTTANFIGLIIYLVRVHKAQLDVEGPAAVDGAVEGGGEDRLPGERMQVEGRGEGQTLG